MTTTPNTELWDDLGGRVACRKHLGGYATSALMENPKLRKIETPITVWRKMSKADCAPDWYPSDAWTDQNDFAMTQDKWEALLATCPTEHRVVYTPSCEACGEGR